MQCGWEQELRATSAGGHLGITPKIIYSHPQFRTMVLEWGGEPAASSSLQSAERLLQLAGILGRLHQTPTALTTPGYTHTLELYLGLIPAETAIEADRDMPAFARYLDCHPCVFCHHDLSLGNLLIEGANINLIDWEYARMGHALFDLGSLIDSLELDSRQSALLLDGYEAPASFYQDLADMLHFIRYLRSLWTMAMTSMRQAAPQC
jgi:Ser/Thr protein kinase RdoA (MazF antagonist)